MKYISKLLLAVVCTINSSSIIAWSLTADNSKNKHYQVWVHFDSSMTGSDWSVTLKPGQTASSPAGWACFRYIHATVNVPVYDQAGKIVTYRNGATISYRIRSYWNCSNHIISFQTTEPSSIIDDKGIEQEVPGTLCMHYHWSSPRDLYQEEKTHYRCVTFAQAEDNNVHIEFKTE